MLDAVVCDDAVGSLCIVQTSPLTTKRTTREVTEEIA